MARIPEGSMPNTISLIQIDKVLTKRRCSNEEIDE